MTAGECWEKCTICKKEKSIGEHNFTKTDTPCVIKCQKCGIMLRQHNWNGCTCTDCGEKSNSDHNFIIVPFAKKRTCSICGETVEREEDEMKTDQIIQKLKSENRPIDFDLATYQCAGKIRSVVSLFKTLNYACKAAGASLPFDEIYEYDYKHVENYLAREYRIVLKFFLTGRYNDNFMLNSFYELSVKDDFINLEEIKKTPVPAFWLAQELLGFNSVAKDITSELTPDKAALLLRKIFELSNE